jgi:hypothetical protein
LYSAAGNSAGVYGGSDQVYIKLFWSPAGELGARGLIRDRLTGTTLIAEGRASAQCAQDSSGNENLEQLQVDFKNVRSGDQVTALITPNGGVDKLGRHTTTLSVGYGLAWEYSIQRANECRERFNR